MTAAAGMDRVIDVDAHVTAPPDLWVERLPADHRDRVPMIRRTTNPGAVTAPGERGAAPNGP